MMLLLEWAHSNSLTDIFVQICEAINVLSTFYPDEKKRCHELIDKLWSGIMDKNKEINVDTIATVFSTLPHLKQV